jgi:8-oxo-dGTP diphosphatase
MIIMKNHPRVRVVAAVVERAGRVLIARRREGDALAGKWEFPGGKIEQGETPEKALRRELREELGIETVIGDLICVSSHAYDHLSVELAAYEARWISGDIVPLVHDEIKWIAPAGLFSYDFPEANIPVIRAILSRGKTGL